MQRNHGNVPDCDGNVLLLTRASDKRVAQGWPSHGMMTPPAPVGSVSLRITRLVLNSSMHLSHLFPRAQGV